MKMSEIISSEREVFQEWSEVIGIEDELNV